MSENGIVLDLNIDFKVPEKERDENYEAKNLAITYISFAAKQKYPDGLDGQRRRVWGRIQRKMDAIQESETETKLSLENAEVDFIKGLFVDSTKFPMQAAKFVMVLEDAIAKL